MRPRPGSYNPSFMQTIVAQLDSAFRAAIRAAFGIDADPLVAVAQNEKFGDYQANAAMGLAKQITEQSGQKKNPRAVAEQIKAKLALGNLAEEVTLAGPGFINVRLSSNWLATAASSLAGDPRLGIEPASQPRRVVVDYSGPNVAKQMHVGHLRSTIIGDAIARVIEFQGHRVIRQNHIGDWGTQFGMLISHLASLGAGDEAHIADLDHFYKEARKRFESDPSFADAARATVVRLQAGGEEELERWQQIVAESRRHFQPIYERLGVGLTPAAERGESFYNPMLADNVKLLRQAGVAVESDGAIVAFAEGVESPLILKKTGGGYGYATTDLAGIRFRVQELGADRIIYVVGAPQAQHFRQVFATARKAGWLGNATAEHAGFGSVLGEDGKMFKARSGDSVKLSELLNEAEERALAVVTQKSPELPEAQRRDIARAVGIGAVKWADLSKDRQGDYVFSWDEMLALKGSTAPYLQYAYARTRAIFRKSGLEPDLSAPVTLATPHELALMKQALRLGEVIDLVSRELKPHHLCTYIYELATRFSAFYENCPVLDADEGTRASRLVLCEVTARTLALGLDLLGIEHPNQM